MRETNFIKQNKEKWEEFEQILENNYKNPEKLNQLFVEITDDLSYSRTFYPNRSVRVYLNSLAQRIFHSIYKNKTETYKRFKLFWTDELPQLVYQARYEFLVSFFIFFVAFAIGVLSSAMDIEFPRVILGDSYVDMTIENIESGDPMRVYKEKDALGMSLGITLNNLYVAFLTFILGVLYAFGTIAILIQNGIMVGAFQYFFYEKGVFWESFLTIWTHGTLEISAIVIAGAAGITMGKGLLFPKTYSRMQSFQLSAKRGFKIMLGITPIFILAGFIEGFFTRFTETPDVIRLLFIIICLTFILFYFGFYPWSKSKTGFATDINKNELPPTKDRAIRYNAIKSIGELFSDVFIFYGQYFKTFIWAAVIGASVFCLFILLSHSEPLKYVFGNGLFSSSSVKMSSYFNNEQLPLLPFFNILIYSILAYLVFNKIKFDWKGAENSQGHTFLSLIKIAVPVGLMTMVMMIDNNGGLTLSIIVFPILILWAFISFIEKINLVKALRKTISMLTMDFLKTIGLGFILILLGLLFYNIFNTMLFGLFIDTISWNFAPGGVRSPIIVMMVTAWSVVFILYMLSFLLFIGIPLLYFSSLEILEAAHLRKQINNIGINTRIQGMEREY